MRSTTSCPFCFLYNFASSLQQISMNVLLLRSVWMVHIVSTLLVHISVKVKKELNYQFIYFLFRSNEGAVIYYLLHWIRSSLSITYNIRRDQRNTFEFIKAVSDTALDMINAAYHKIAIDLYGSCDLLPKRSPDKNQRLFMITRAAQECWCVKYYRIDLD